MSSSALTVLLVAGAFVSGIVISIIALKMSGSGAGGSSSATDKTSKDASEVAGGMREQTEPLEEPEREAQRSVARHDNGSRDPDSIRIQPDASGPGAHADGAQDVGTEKISRDEIESIVAPDSESERAYLVVVAGSRVGKMIPVENELILGRDPESADIWFRDDAVSSVHAELYREEHEMIIEDLDSANGTYVNANRVSKMPLQDGDKITLGRTTVLKFTFQDELDEEFQQQMYESSTRDELTGALTKAHFMDRMNSELSYARRHETNICMVIFDLDHFKRLNDRYGHVTGDRVLRTIGELVASVTRDEALFARYGGEEFIISERDAGRKKGYKIAERVRETIQRQEFDVDGDSVKVTMSFGVADLACVDELSLAALIDRADEALYRAKEAGRNCTKVAEPV